MNHWNPIKVLWLRSYYTQINYKNFLNYLRKIIKFALLFFSSSFILIFVPYNFPSSCLLLVTFLLFSEKHLQISHPFSRAFIWTIFELRLYFLIRILKRTVDLILYLPWLVLASTFTYAFNNIFHSKYLLLWSEYWSAENRDNDRFVYR